MRAGNHQLARELFKAALKVDPKNETTWGTWIAMEEDLGRLTAANELRIRRSEQQWEFVIPSSFSTRPGASVFDSLLNTLNSFFSARSSNNSSSSGSSSNITSNGAGRGLGVASSSGSSSSSSGVTEGGLRSMLGSDFQMDMSLEDMIAEATAAALPELQVPGAAAAAEGPGSTLGYRGGDVSTSTPSSSSSSSSMVGNGMDKRRNSRRVPPVLGRPVAPNRASGSSELSSSSSSSGSSPGDGGDGPSTSRAKPEGESSSSTSSSNGRSRGSSSWQGRRGSRPGPIGEDVAVAAAAAAAAAGRRVPAGMKSPPQRRPRAFRQKDSNRSMSGEKSSSGAAGAEE